MQGLRLTDENHRGIAKKIRMQRLDDWCVYWFRAIPLDNEISTGSTFQIFVLQKHGCARKRGKDSGLQGIFTNKLPDRVKVSDRADIHRAMRIGIANGEHDRQRLFARLFAPLEIAMQHLRIDRC